jgi:hypothetical protein
MNQLQHIFPRTQAEILSRSRSLNTEIGEKIARLKEFDEVEGVDLAMGRPGIIWTESSNTTLDETVKINSSLHFDVDSGQAFEFYENTDREIVDPNGRNPQHRERLKAKAYCKPGATDEYNVDNLARDCRGEVQMECVREANLIVHGTDNFREATIGREDGSQDYFARGHRSFDGEPSWSADVKGFIVRE